ncbi:MAG: hypothetical protein ACW98Y_06570 [Candidatus Thorarchaeota archaeon]|jgi:hypothetical protein
MSEENESEVSKNETSSEIAQYFFDPPESYWPIIAVLIAISIFSLWTLRSAFEMMYAIILIVIYGIVSLLTIRFRFRNIQTSREDTHVIFSFTRNGVSWKALVQALLGAAIPLLFAWFVIFNSIPDSTDLADFVMLVAMLLYIGIVPLTPALAAIPKLNVLKTTVMAKIDLESQDVIEFEIDINPLDGYWHDNREDSEFLDAIRNKIISFLNEQDSI